MGGSTDQVIGDHLIQDQSETRRGNHFPMTKRDTIKALSIVPKLDEVERPTFLEKLGFRPLKVATPYCEIYRNDRHQLIVKNGCFIGSPPRHLRVPTVLLNETNEPTPLNRRWVRQPICDTKNPAGALRSVMKQLSKRTNKTFVDAHLENVGHINRKGKRVAVLFDW